MTKVGTKKHRSAITGRYVKTSYAKRNPTTTVSEATKNIKPQKKSSN